MENLGVILELERLPSVLKFLIKSGIYWPIASFVFWYQSELHSANWLIIFICASFLLLFYPYYWKKYGDMKENEYQIKLSSFKKESQKAYEQFIELIQYINENDPSIMKSEKYKKAYQSITEFLTKQ